jgi:hypothetical protein
LYHNVAIPTYMQFRPPIRHITPCPQKGPSNSNSNTMIQQPAPAHARRQEQEQERGARSEEPEPEPGGAAPVLLRVARCANRGPRTWVLDGTPRVHWRGAGRAGLFACFFSAKWRLFHCRQPLRPFHRAAATTRGQGALWGSPDRKSPPLGASNQDHGLLGYGIRDTG